MSFFNIIASITTQGNHPSGVINPLTTDVNLVFDGDSLTRGTGATQTQDYPKKVYNDLTGVFNSLTYYSFGVGGQTIEDMLVDDVTQIHSLVDPAKVNILMVWGDANSLGYIGGQTAQQCFDSIVNYSQRARNAGFDYIILLTSHYFRKVNGTFPNNQEPLEANRHDFYELVKNSAPANYPWDYHIDLRDAENIGGAAGQEINYTYFADFVHFTLAGYNIVASKVIIEINKIFGL